MPFAVRLTYFAVLLLAAGGVVLSTPQGVVAPAPAEATPAPPVRTVVIDPGHGGDDRGATGPAGLEEKQVALSVAQRVRTLGGPRGLRVLLTRDDDRQVTLMQRAAFANGGGGVLFVSLHANASPSPLTSGPEIGSYNGAGPIALEAPDERLLLVPLAAGGSRRVAVVSWDHAQTRHAEMAGAFAAHVGERLQRVAPLGPRGVYRSVLRPLAAINMPAVLLDLAYLTNPDEERLTAGEAHQAALAQALVDAALTFDPLPPTPAAPR